MAGILEKPQGLGDGDDTNLDWNFVLNESLFPICRKYILKSGWVTSCRVTFRVAFV